MSLGVRIVHLTLGQAHHGARDGEPLLPQHPIQSLRGILGSGARDDIEERDHPLRLLCLWLPHAHPQQVGVEDEEGDCRFEG